MFEGDLTCLNHHFNCFPPIIFYHVTPIFFDPEGICFGAPASQIPTFVDDGEDVCLQLPSHNGKVSQGSMARGYLYEAFLSMT